MKKRKRVDFSIEEKIIKEAIIHAREVQEYLWDDDSFLHKNICESDWVRVFQKRVDKIKELDFTNPGVKVELKKRLLQQAALSILALRILKQSRL